MLSMPLFLLEPGPTRPNVLACFASVPTYAYATYASVSADAYTTESNGLTDSYATHALAYSATTSAATRYAPGATCACISFFFYLWITALDYSI